MKELCAYWRDRYDWRKHEALLNTFPQFTAPVAAGLVTLTGLLASGMRDLYALIARMKILSSDAVIVAAEKAGRLILETYLSPNRTFVDLPDLINEMDPLRDFSEACRCELQSSHGR